MSNTSSWVYDNFKSMTEFLNGRTGDCMWTALLSLLHLVDARRWPLNAAGLNALVLDAKSRGLTDANGLANIPDLDRYLSAVGVHHTTVGYNDFTEDKLRWRLDGLSDPTRRAPLLVEWSDAGAGLHDDEPNVKYHGSSFGGVTTAGLYLRSDGDSRTDHRDGTTTDPIPTNWQDITNARPIAYIVIDAAATAPGSTGNGAGGSVPAGWSDDGTTLTAPNGHKVVLGFRSYVLSYAVGWPADDQPIEEEQHKSPVSVSHPELGDGQRQLFTRSGLVWTVAGGVQLLDGCSDLHATEAALNVLQGQVSQLQAQIQQMQQNETKGAALISAMKTALG